MNHRADIESKVLFCARKFQSYHYGFDWAAGNIMIDGWSDECVYKATVLSVSAAIRSLLRTKQIVHSGIGRGR